MRRTVDELVAGGGELRPTRRRDARRRASRRRTSWRSTRSWSTRSPAACSSSQSPTRASRPAEFAWLALGSQARRETAPSADVDSAIVWFGDGRRGRESGPTCTRSRPRSSPALERCGLRVDEHGATASNLLFVRSLDVLAACGAQLDRRPDPGEGADPRLGARRQPAGVGGSHRHARGRHLPPGAAQPRRCCGCSPASRSPTGRRPGFFRGLVVEHSGEHRGRLDLKHGGVIPIVDLARWAGMAAGVTSASTPERLRAAGAGGHAGAGRRPHARGRVRADRAPPARRTRSSSCAPARSRTTTSTRRAQRADAQPPEGGVPGRRLDPEAGRRRAERRDPMRPATGRTSGRRSGWRCSGSP